MTLILTEHQPMLQHGNWCIFFLKISCIWKCFSMLITKNQLIKEKYIKLWLWENELPFPGFVPMGKNLILPFYFMVWYQHLWWIKTIINKLCVVILFVEANVMVQWGDWGETFHKLMTTSRNDINCAILSPKKINIVSWNI